MNFKVGQKVRMIHGNGRYGITRNGSEGIIKQVFYDELRVKWYKLPKNWSSHLNEEFTISSETVEIIHSKPINIKEFGKVI